MMLSGKNSAGDVTRAPRSPPLLWICCPSFPQPYAETGSWEPRFFLLSLGGLSVEVQPPGAGQAGSHSTQHAGEGNDGRERACGGAKVCPEPPLTDGELRWSSLMSCIRIPHLPRPRAPCG